MSPVSEATVESAVLITSASSWLLRRPRMTSRWIQPRVPEMMGCYGRAKTNRLFPVLGRSSGVNSRKRPEPVLTATY